MKLFKKWGATDYNRALEFAVSCDHIRNYVSLKDWDATNHNSSSLVAAKLLKDWGTTTYDIALTDAEKGGHISAMKLLSDWGATSYDIAMTDATNGKHFEAMKLLKEWGATNYFYDNILCL